MEDSLDPIGSGALDTFQKLPPKICRVERWNACRMAGRSNTSIDEQLFLAFLFLSFFVNIKVALPLYNFE
jgi:hypothetical protein